MEQIERISVSEELQHFIVQIVGATRKTDGIKVGASPRASLSLMKIAQVNAAFDGRDFVIPDDILRSAVDVLAHRLILDNVSFSNSVSRETLVLTILEGIKVPV